MSHFHHFDARHSKTARWSFYVVIFWLVVTLALWFLPVTSGPSVAIIAVLALVSVAAGWTGRRSGKRRKPRRYQGSHLYTGRHTSNYAHRN